MTTIETWLPVFPGFYSTIFEANIEDELYHQNSERDTNLPKIDYDDIDFQYKDYETEVVKQCCSFLENELGEFVTSIKFQNVVSPKEYNFANDSGNIEVGLTKKNIKSIRNYIYSHREQYEEWLKKKYTSYDGFLSWYDNNFDGWKQYTDDFTDFSQKSHYLGSVLEFICDEGQISDESMYYSIEVYPSEYCKNRVNQLKCEECGDWYKIKESPELLEYDGLVKKQTSLWNELQGHLPSKIKTFKECYPEFSYKCNICKE